MDANRRRVELLRGITARSLAVQGTDWTWVVTVNPDDPMLGERMDAFRSAGAPVVPVHGDSADAIDWSGPVLTTRIDDDDAFAPDAFQRLHRFVRKTSDTTALIFPFGYRTFESRYDLIRHRKNAWVSLYAPSERVHVRAVQHQRIHRHFSVREVDHRIGWLWVRHPGTNSGFRRAQRPLTDDIRAMFPIDWSLIE